MFESEVASRLETLTSRTVWIALRPRRELSRAPDFVRCSPILRTNEAFVVDDEARALCVNEWWQEAIQVREQSVDYGSEGKSFDRHANV